MDWNEQKMNVMLLTQLPINLQCLLQDLEKELFRNRQDELETALSLQLSTEEREEVCQIK